MEQILNKIRLVLFKHLEVQKLVEVMNEIRGELKEVGKTNNNGKKVALDIMDEWNDFAGRYNLNRVLKITDKRTSNVNQRLTEADFNIYHIFQRIEQSDFLRGKNKEGWKVDFDFVFGSKNNWVKIMEGKYANNKGSVRKPNHVSPEEIRDDLNQAFSKS